MLGFRKFFLIINLIYCLGSDCLFLQRLFMLTLARCNKEFFPAMFKWMYKTKKHNFVNFSEFLKHLWIHAADIYIPMLSNYFNRILQESFSVIEPGCFPGIGPTFPILLLIRYLLIIENLYYAVSHRENEYRNENRHIHFLEL